MGMIFSPDGIDLHVNNPGYGELVAESQQRTAVEGEVELWRRVLLGPDLGRFLFEVTASALTGDRPPGARLLPPWFTAAQARAGLAAVQQAVLLAAAGTDRFERTFPDPDEPPAQPVCVRCGEGTPFTPGALASPWCDQHGHAAYGYPSEGTWERAQERYQWRRDWWESTHRPWHTSDDNPDLPL